MCHFNIAVDWTYGLASQGCIQDANLYCESFAGHRVCFVNTSIDIGVTVWVHTIELVVCTAIPEVSVVEDSIDHGWRVTSRYLTGVDTGACKESIWANNTGIFGAEATDSESTICEANKVSFEDTLRSDDVVSGADLWRCDIKGICELGQWEVCVELELEVVAVSGIEAGIWARVELVDAAAIGAGIIVAGCTCLPGRANLHVPEESLAQADGCCTVLDVDIEVSWHWNLHLIQSLERDWNFGRRRNLCSCLGWCKHLHCTDDSGEA